MCLGMICLWNCFIHSSGTCLKADYTLQSAHLGSRSAVLSELRSVHFYSLETLQNGLFSVGKGGWDCCVLWN